LVYRFIKRTSILFAAALLPTLVLATDYNLGKLARSNKIELFNRALDQTKSGAPEAMFLNSAEDYGLAWITTDTASSSESRSRSALWVTGVEFSNGTIELELKGRDQPGQSFVGIAFHGQNNKTFDAVYLRPFNFQAAEAEHRSHSIQYVSLPEHDWSNLRKNHPGKYEAALNPAPMPESWVKLRLVVEGKRVSAFVNGAAKPSLTVELLKERHEGKVGLWVGNGSDGWFRNLTITPAAKRAGR